MKKNIFFILSLFLFINNAVGLSFFNKILLRILPTTLAVRAIKSDDIETIEKCIGRIDINGRDSEGKTLLHHAFLHHKIDIFEYLILHGADVNAQDKQEYSVLHYAAQSGDISFVKLLISHGADVKISTQYGYTPFILAKDNGYIEICNLLIQKGAYTIFEAARYGDREAVINFLAENIENVNAKTVLDITPLHMAAMKGHVDVVGLLLKNGSDINARDHNEWTPLHFAITSHQTDVVELLIKHGADITTPFSYDGFTPLHFAIIFKCLPIVSLLISNNAPINARTKDGLTPLAWALDMFMGDKNIADYLRTVGGIK